MSYNIGYMHADWGMEGYYRQMDELDAITHREEYLRENYTADCRTIAMKAVKPYALANGEDYYQEWGIDGDTASWQDWLREDAAATGCIETAEAMILLIADEADFTRYEWVEAEAAKQLPRKQAA